MLELIKEENVEVGVHAADWEDAIRRSAQHLLETGKIEERYIRAMIDAVHRVGPYIVLGNHVALAHARPECGVNELSVHFTTLHFHQVWYPYTAKGPAGVCDAGGGEQRCQSIEGAWHPASC